MVLGLGADVVRVARLKTALLRHARLKDRLFTPAEQAACVAAADPYPKFATRFAAKEAFLKALGTGWANGIRWTDVEVTGGGSVAPHLAIQGRAAEILAARGGSASHLSLSHDGEYAFAVCILEAQRQRQGQRGANHQVTKTPRKEGPLLTTEAQRSQRKTLGARSKGSNEHHLTPHT